MPAGVSACRRADARQACGSGCFHLTAVKGSSGDGTGKFDYGFCFVLWDILSFAGVAHSVEYRRYTPSYRF